MPSLFLVLLFLTPFASFFRPASCIPVSLPSALSFPPSVLASPFPAHYRAFFLLSRRKKVKLFPCTWLRDVFFWTSISSFSFFFYTLLFIGLLFSFFTTCSIWIILLSCFYVCYFLFFECKLLCWLFFLYNLAWLRPYTVVHKWEIRLDIFITSLNLLFQLQTLFKSLIGHLLYY